MSIQSGRGGVGGEGRGGERGKWRREEGSELVFPSLVCCREEFTYEDQALTDSAELKIDQQVGAVCMRPAPVQCVQPVCADVCRCTVSTPRSSTRRPTLGVGSSAVCTK